MDNITTDLVVLYCIAQKLTYVDHILLARYYGGEEEWENVKCAGVDEMGTPFVIQEDDDRVKVVCKYADGLRCMEDEWRYVTEADLKSGRRLHAK